MGAGVDVGSGVGNGTAVGVGTAARTSCTRCSIRWSISSAEGPQARASKTGASSPDSPNLLNRLSITRLDESGLVSRRIPVVNVDCDDLAEEVHGFNTLLPLAYP